jgi:hypothetical protein
MQSENERYSNRVSKRAELYLSREEKLSFISVEGKGVEKLPYTWESSFSRGFYKDFISWLKGSWLCLCATGLFMGCTSVPAHGLHRVLHMLPFLFKMALRPSSHAFPISRLE